MVKSRGAMTRTLHCMISVARECFKPPSGAEVGGNSKQNSNEFF